MELIAVCFCMGLDIKTCHLNRFFNPSLQQFSSFFLHQITNRKINNTNLVHGKVQHLLPSTWISMSSEKNEQT